jgi:CRP/FNR family cyclic AMP-dependent transcriptional regulator
MLSGTTTRGAGKRDTARPGRSQKTLLDVAMLDDIPLFSDLDKAELALLSGKAVTRQYPRNTIILSEGDHSDSLYIIRSGRVKVFLGNDDGREVILNVQGPGEYFGELALIDSGPRSASVISQDKCLLSIISKGDFEGFLQQHPAATFKIMRGLVKRLRSLTENVRSLALMDVYGRVARLLLKLSQAEGDVRVIRDALTQQDIADRVGASREMVSRILKDLREGGYIEVHERHITIRERLPHGW